METKSEKNSHTKDINTVCPSGSSSQVIFKKYHFTPCVEIQTTQR